MLAFTLDTNCVIALDENRPAAPAIRRLAEAYATGNANVAVVAIMASEKQRAGGYIESFEVFERRLETLGISHLVQRFQNINRLRLIFHLGRNLV